MCLLPYHSMKWVHRDLTAPTSHTSFQRPWWVFLCCFFLLFRCASLLLAVYFPQGRVKVFNLNSTKRPNDNTTQLLYAALSNCDQHTVCWVSRGGRAHTCLSGVLWCTLHYVPLTVFLLGRVLAACKKVRYQILSIKTAFIIRVTYCISWKITRFVSHFSLSHN